ncbi:MAG: 3-dehydroquinate synthase [Candidatus Methanosuratincola sp.]|jgi:3-dehydroquinate synthase
MDTVRVTLRTTEDRSYDIKIGENLFPYIARELPRLSKAHQYVIVTDSNVEALYAKPLLDELRKAGIVAHAVSFPAGEQNKTREQKQRLEDYMLELKMGRDSMLIALGGGVVGDLAGFVAATYLRGIPYVQVPTTLVACVDSSIGGKTAVDTPHGKNLIGAFFQPRGVFVDVATLRTLPERELRGGLAEVIKYGVIADRNLFHFLEENIDRVFELDVDTLKRIIKRSCEIKGEVVTRDEREENLRKILNFGHTIGHAIERLSDYTLLHGEAISVGMALEGKIASQMGIWDAVELERLLALLTRAGLPCSPPEGLDLSSILDVMRLDKKARGGGIEMVFPRAIGEMATDNGRYGIKVDEKSIVEACSP